MIQNPIYSENPIYTSDTLIQEDDNSNIIEESHEKSQNVKEQVQPASQTIKINKTTNSDSSFFFFSPANICPKAGLGRNRLQNDVNDSEWKRPGPYLCDLPSEILHIILSYYTHTFQGLIHFGTLNKQCSVVSNSSLIWISSPACHVFYVSKKFYRCFHNENFPESENVAEYLENHYFVTQTFNYQIKRLVCFEEETTFPPVLKVVVSLPTITALTADDPEGKSLYPDGLLPYQFANRYRNYFMNLFVSYSRLWHQHVTYHAWNEFLSPKVRWLFSTSTVYLYGIATVVLLSFTVYFWNEFPSSTSLTVKNQLGFVCLYFINGIAIILNVLSISATLLESLTYSYETLKTKLTYRSIVGLDVIGILLWVPLISLILIQLHLSGRLSISWTEITIPGWILTTLGLVCAIVGNIGDGLSEISFLLLSYSYLCYSLLLTFTLVGLYFDDDQQHNGIKNLGFTLIPLYPMFIGVFIVCFITCMSTYGEWYTYFIKKQDIGFRLSSQLLSNVLVLAVSFASLLSIIGMCFAVLMLNISCFQINNTEWDKDALGYHFPPIVLILMGMINGICFMMFFSLEEILIS